jgi:hypothetical protein
MLTRELSGHAQSRTCVLTSRSLSLSLSLSPGALTVNPNAARVQAPSRKKDEPAGQTLRVRLADFADYCMGTAELPSYLNDYERGDAPGLPTRPFALLGWSPFYEHRTLAAHFERPAFAPDATPEVRRAPPSHILTAPASLSHTGWIALLSNSHTLGCVSPRQETSALKGEALAQHRRLPKPIRNGWLSGHAP